MAETGTDLIETRPEERAVAIKPKLTEAAIAAITYDLQMAEKLVTEALEEGVDYGQIPSVAGKGLWDPGASKIMNAFETYPRHKVLYHEETDNLITWAIEAEIVHRASGQVVGAGVGACSTREPKYKYRWVGKEEARRLGYSEPEIDTMKTKKSKRRTDDDKFFEVIEYRVENPEYGEQVNTIMQMSAKRAETDAAKTLPGVASALRKLLDPDRSKTASSTKAKKGKVEDTDEDSPRWTTFWNAAKDILGYDYSNKVHQILGVKSVQDWLKTGKSLDDAIKLISEKLSAQQVNNDPAEKPSPSEWNSIKKEDVPDLLSLEKKFCKLTGKSTQDMYKELGVSSRRDMTLLPWEAFLQLKETFAPSASPDIEWDDLN